MSVIKSLHTSWFCAILGCIKTEMYFIQLPSPHMSILMAKWRMKILEVRNGMHKTMQELIS